MEGSYTIPKGEVYRFTLLRELFEISDGIFCSVDVKDSDDGLVNKVSDLVKEFKREDITFLGSMYDE